MLTTYVRCKIGFGGGPSAESAAVTAKIEKKSYNILILGFSKVMISNMISLFHSEYPHTPTRAPLGGRGGVETTEDNLI